MDIGNVHTVVQYKATCEFCSLWQRFGRAARQPGTKGVGILLVEGKDVRKSLKTVNTANKKKNESNDPPKKKRRSNRERTFKEEEAVQELYVEENDPIMEPIPTPGDPELQNWIAERRQSYLKPEVHGSQETTAKKGKNPGVAQDSALHDYINPPSFVTCRRLIPQLYFANNKRSEFFFFLGSIC